MSELPEVRKIAVLRANAIGDYIFALPALDALRAAYPQAEIVYLGQPWHEQFLSGRPGPIDRVIIVPRSKGVREDRETPGEEDSAEVFERFWAAMKVEGFDLALQMHGGGRNSNPFLLKLGARFAVGLRTPDAPELDRWVPYVYWQHEIPRFLEVVSLVGAQAVTLEPHLALTPADLREADQLVPQERGELLVAMHCAVGDPRRRWPAGKFAAVGDALAERGAQVLLTGAGFDEEIINEVASGMRHEPMKLAGRLSLGGLAGLLSRCAVMVSNDSGPLHLAHAVGAKTVGIYWCGNLVTAGPLTRSRHRPHPSFELTCSACGANIIYAPCSHQVSFVDCVTVDEVQESALALLESD
jgi:ADP-heptose:LPS heptosyltransferase